MDIKEYTAEIASIISKGMLKFATEERLLIVDMSLKVEDDGHVVTAGRVFPLSAIPCELTHETWETYKETIEKRGEAGEFEKTSERVCNALMVIFDHLISDYNVIINNFEMSLISLGTYSIDLGVISFPGDMNPIDALKKAKENTSKNLSKDPHAEFFIN